MYSLAARNICSAFTILLYSCCPNVNTNMIVTLQIIFTLYWLQWWCSEHEINIQCGLPVPSVGISDDGVWSLMNFSWCGRPAGKRLALSLMLTHPVLDSVCRYQTPSSCTIIVSPFYNRRGPCDINRSLNSSVTNTSLISLAYSLLVGQFFFLMQRLLQFLCNRIVTS